jgi:biopolymer transport protein ExbD
VTTRFFKKPAYSQKAPETVTREGAMETPKDLTIVITAEGDTYVEGTKLDAPALQMRLQAIVSREKAGLIKEPRVLIKGDRNAQYARIMDVMDMVRQAGLTRVVFPTDPKTLRPNP